MESRELDLITYTDYTELKNGKLKCLHCDKDYDRDYYFKTHIKTKKHKKELYGPLNDIFKEEAISHIILNYKSDMDFLTYKHKKELVWRLRDRMGRYSYEYDYETGKLSSYRLFLSKEENIFGENDLMLIHMNTISTDINGKTTVEETFDNLIMKANNKYVLL